MSTETPKFFYAHYEIQNMSDGARVGTKLLTFVGGKQVTIPEWEATVAITPEATDLSWVSNERNNYVIGKVMVLLKDLDILVEETPALVQKLINSMGANEERVKLAPMGIADKYHVRLSDWQSVLDRFEVIPKPADISPDVSTPNAGC